MTGVIITSTAQSNYFGIKGGVNLVTQKFTGSGISTTPDRAVKLHFGFLYNSMLSDNFAIQPELHYSQHGFEPVDGSGIDDIDFNYIAIPVMFKYYASEKFNIHAGPELAFLIGGTEVNGVSVTDETKETNVSLAIGLEFFVAENVSLSGRYLGGVVDIDELFDDLDQKTDNIQLSLVVKLN